MPKEIASEESIVKNCNVSFKVIPQFCIAHFICAYLNVAYGIIYEDKLNCKRQRKSKDKEKTLCINQVCFKTY